MTSIGLHKAAEWQKRLDQTDPIVDQRLQAIYGPNPDVIEARHKLLREAVSTFVESYGSDREILISRAPGRINLLGNHIDHRGGYLNYMAIDRDTLMVASPNDDDTVRAQNSLDSRFEPFEFRIGDLLPVKARGRWHDYIEEVEITPRIWQNYVQAAVLYLQDQNPDRELIGMDLAVHGDVPIAAGLSSSSTLVVSAFQACKTFNDIQIPRDTQAEFCGAAEWYAGTRGGSGDHAAMLYSKRQAILHLRFFPLVNTEVPFPEGYRVVACNSCVEHAPPGIFNERVATYEIGLMMLQKRYSERLQHVEHLRDLVPDGQSLTTVDFYKMLKDLPERASREEIRADLSADKLTSLFAPHPEPGEGYRIRQVMLYGVAECARSAKSADLLFAGQIEAFGNLKALSHDGDRQFRFGKDGKPSSVNNRVTEESVDALISSKTEIHTQSGGYDCSCEELDHLVDIAQNVDGVVGAGLTGGGLGGCVLVLVKETQVDRLIDALQEEFYDARGLQSDILVCTSVEGAGIL